MMKTVTRHLVALAAIIVFLPVDAQAQPKPHTDIEIELIDGVLATEPRIGEGEFGEAPNAANLADEPGFEADDGVLQADDVVNVDVADVAGSHLWYWDGNGEVSFGVSASSLMLRNPLTNETAELISSESGGASGIFLGMADDEGGLHQDIEFELSDATPDAGVYLFGLQLDSPSYERSLPVYMVLASGVDEDAHEAAVAWTATTFNIPEPSSMCSLLIALVVAGSQIRRKVS